MSKKLPLNKRMTKVVAQIMTYYYNSLVDAKITEEFVHHFQSRGRKFATQGTVTQKRAQRLLEAVEEYSRDFLIGLAFTIYRTNGYGNYICAKRMQNALKSKHKAGIDLMIREFLEKMEKELGVKHDYHQEKDGWLPFFGFWAETSMRTFKQANDFAKKWFKHQDKLNKRQVVRACLTVQKQNSRHNLSIARQLFEKDDHDDNPKIKFLREAADYVEHSDIFLKTCALTQKIAAHSDRTLVGVLKLRFPRSWLTIRRRRKKKR